MLGDEQHSAIYLGSCMQAAAGRCIPVLAQHTYPGNVILSAGTGAGSVGLAPPATGDRELERLCLGHLTAAARSAFAGLADAPVSPSPEDGRSTDGDDSDAISGVPFTALADL